MDLQANRQTTTADLASLLDGWALDGHGALPRRLAHALRRVITAGVLPAGIKLPPERQLARELAVSRATVSHALDELRAEGLLASRQGSGTRISAVDRGTAVGTRIAEHLLTGPGVDLATGNPPDVSHLPPIELDMAALNAVGGGAGLDPCGLPVLREALAEMYRAGGVTGPPRPTEAEQIHVTAGAHQAIALLLGALVGRRQTVAFAEFNYPGLFDIVDTIEAQPVSVRSDSGGMLPEALAEAIAVHRPAAVYIQCGPHNPTGKVSRRARLSALAEVLDDSGVTVIEDHTLAPLAFRETPISLLELCRRAPVVVLGSMSKTCWAGLRLGWIRGSGPLMERAMLRHLASDLGPAVPSQVLALGLLPHLDDIVAERRRQLTAAVDVAAERLVALLPEAAFETPDGGLSLWVRFPLADAGLLARHARRFGVRVAPGSIHVAGRHPQPYLRLCPDRPHDHLAEGIARLAQAWRDLGAT